MTAITRHRGPSPKLQVLLATALAVAGVQGCRHTQHSPGISSPWGSTWTFPGSGHRVPANGGEYPAVVEELPPYEGEPLPQLLPHPEGQPEGGPQVLPPLPPQEVPPQRISPRNTESLPALPADPVTEPVETQRRLNPGIAPPSASRNLLRHKFTSLFTRAPAAPAVSKNRSAPSRVVSTPRSASEKVAPQPGDTVANVARQPQPANSLPAARHVVNAQPVKLTSPPEVYEYWEERAPAPNQATAGSSPWSSAPATDFNTTPMNPFQTGMAAGSRQVPALDASTSPVLPGATPEWSRSKDGAAHGYGTPGAPVKQLHPPRPLDLTPLTSADNAPASDFVIDSVALCEEVRSYEDYVEVDRYALTPGQPILVYATLRNFQSVPSAEGFRTMTLSSMEVRTRHGDLVVRQPLGTAVDLARTPRRDYFLTHHVRIPAEVPAGDYVLHLNVFDLLGQQSTQAQMNVYFTGDRTRPGGTDDTGKFATRPERSLR